MAVKIFFTDLDGTLLGHSRDTVSVKNIEAIEKLKAAGVYVAISTGRAFRSSENIIDAVKPDFFIGMNGGFILNTKTGETVGKSVLPQETTNAILGICYKYDVSFFALCYDGLHTSVTGMKRIEENIESSEYLQNYKDLLTIFEDKDFNKVEAVTFAINAKDQGTSKKVLDELDKLPGIYYVSCANNSFDILPVGLDKSVGLQKVCDELGIDIKDAAAIGDSENDIAMLKAVGTPIAVDNAYEHVKEFAKHIVPSNVDNGVAYAIEKIILNR